MALRETVSDVLLETLQAAGMRFLFANLGTDYPPILETLAKYGAAGAPLPRMVICPHETTAITAAHGAYLAGGRGQGVLVHVGVGTHNLGGAVQQAWTSRVPMLVFAGRTPATTRGDVLGSRDNYIHYYQDVRDQAGVMRSFTKWEFNLELPEQAAYALQRGLRVMHSEPAGAVYVTAGREVLAMPVPPGLRSDPQSAYAEPRLGGLAAPDAERIAGMLAQAQRPLIVTSYLGRRREAVEVLVALSEALGVPVIEPRPPYLNFPRTHANHWGFRAAPAIQEADLVLLVDCDVPWIHKTGGPKPGTPIVQLDVDPVKAHMTIWDFPVTESHAVDSLHALGDVLGAARSLPRATGAAQTTGAAKTTAAAKTHAEWLARHRPTWPAAGADGRLTVVALSALLARELGPDAVLFDEGVSHSDDVRQGTRCARPGGYFGQGGGSLGWGGGAALGYKLMRPEAEVAWITGDGSFVFAAPTSLYLTAQRYAAPFLTVILNNGGWRAVRAATDQMYGPAGHAARAGEYHHRIEGNEHLEQVAAAFGCHVADVKDPDAFVAAVREARRQVAQGRASVINAHVVEA